MDKDKIEDRKRPAGTSDDGAPPRKKLAVNGGVAKDDYEGQPEEVWIEVSRSRVFSSRRLIFPVSFLHFSIVSCHFWTS